MCDKDVSHSSRGISTLVDHLKSSAIGHFCKKDPVSQPVPKKLAVGMQQAWIRNKEKQRKNPDAVTNKKVSLGAPAAKPAPKTAAKRKILELAQSATSLESKQQKPTADPSEAACQTQPGITTDSEPAEPAQPAVCDTPAPPAKKVQKTMTSFFRKL
ncbi:hypothetical protein ACOMHN_044932 [Nucella lapillus]